jgi:hypothetical protein
MRRAARIFPPERPYWLGCLTLAGLVGAVFWPVLSFDFVRWDDDINITQNPLLTAPWSWRLVGQFFAGDQALRFKPLHWLCDRLLYAVFGFNPAGWHAFNLGLHVVAAVLFYVVLRQVFARFAPWPGKFVAEWGAWFGAALWALHPLRAEAVGWATGSTYPLTAVALLASFACYLNAHGGSAPSRGWIVLAWVFAVAAYASYPVSVTYGIWLLVVDRWLLRPLQSAQVGPGKFGMNRARAVKHVWFLAPAVLAVGVTLWSRFASPGIFTTAPTVDSVGLLSRLAMALASLSYLVRSLFWPVALTPNMPWLVNTGSIQLQVAWMAMLALLGLVFVWRRRRRQPALAAVCLGFAALAVPCMGWTERPTWPVDRYSYIVHLVLIGGLAGWLIRRIGDSGVRRAGLATLAAGLVLISALGARGQTKIWRDSHTLFTHMEQHPRFADNPRQQGHVYVLWGRSEAVAAHPVVAAELFNRAQQVYLAAIRAAVAEQDYAEALALSTHLEHNFILTPVMRRERGAWLFRLGRPREALVELRLAQQALPDDQRVRALIEEAQR